MFTALRVIIQIVAGAAEKGHPSRAKRIREIFRSRTAAISQNYNKLRQLYAQSLLLQAVPYQAGGRHLVLSTTIPAATLSPMQCHATLYSRSTSLSVCRALSSSALAEIGKSQTSR